MTVFKRYRTPSGGHATLSEAWAGPGFSELKEDPLGIDGKPKLPIQPVRKTVDEPKPARRQAPRKATGDQSVTATKAADTKANEEAKK